MNVELIFRLTLAALFAVGGAYVGTLVIMPIGTAEVVPVGAGVVFGCALGLVGAPYLTTRPVGWVAEHGRRLPARDLVAALLGLLFALVLSALTSIPLSSLPSIFGRVLPFIATLFLAYLGVTLFVARKDDIFSLLSVVRRGDNSPVDVTPGVLLDTSAIIDGRIADISEAGFVTGPLRVPRFVLSELQHIADSADSLRRNRGRRGLELLNRLRSSTTVPFHVEDVDGDGSPVDACLVQLARQLRCPIVTNDYNLNRVAAVQGVHVLNVNALANAVKTVLLPGEELNVRIIQDGKEPGQGIAFLDDGTMVVVEGGKLFVHSAIDVVVTRTFQTAAGRMIFAQPRAPSEAS